VLSAPFRPHWDPMGPRTLFQDEDIHVVLRLRIRGAVTPFARTTTRSIA
jgi:hypothetical protein